MQRESVTASSHVVLAGEGKEVLACRTFVVVGQVMGTAGTGLWDGFRVCCRDLDHDYVIELRVMAN